MATKGVKLGLLACAALAGGCANVAQQVATSKISPVALESSRHLPLLPPFGLRVASATESPNLLPADMPLRNDGVGFSGIYSVPLAALPSPISRELLAEFDHGSTPADAEPTPFLLAYYGAPASLLEQGLESSEGVPLVRVSETRFLHEMPSQLFGELAQGWSEEFRLVAQTLPSRPVGAADAFTAAESLDPLADERNHSGWLRGKKKFGSSLRGGAKDSTEGAPVLDQLRDWRNQPVNFVLALVGGGLEQDTPEGGKLIFGSQFSELSTADNPAELVKVRYLLGPFEARAQTREAWARVRTDFLGCSVSLRTAYKYLAQEQSYQLVMSRPLSENTTLRLLGGSGVGSETFTGYSPYPEDPREDRRLALLLVLDRRF